MPKSVDSNSSNVLKSLNREAPSKKADINPISTNLTASNVDVKFIPHKLEQPKLNGSPKLNDHEQQKLINHFNKTNEYLLKHLNSYIKYQNSDNKKPLSDKEQQKRREKVTDRFKGSDITIIGEKVQWKADKKPQDLKAFEKIIDTALKNCGNSGSHLGNTLEEVKRHIDYIKSQESQIDHLKKLRNNKSNNNLQIVTTGTYLESSSTKKTEVPVISAAPINQGAKPGDAKPGIVSALSTKTEKVSTLVNENSKNSTPANQLFSAASITQGAKPVIVESAPSTDTKKSSSTSVKNSTPAAQLSAASITQDAKPGKASVSSSDTKGSIWVGSIKIIQIVCLPLSLINLLKTMYSRISVIIP